MKQLPVTYAGGRRNRSFASYVGLLWPILILLIGFWVPVFVWLLKASNPTTQTLIYSGDAFEKLMFNTTKVAALTTISSLLLAYPLAILWWTSGKRVSTLIASVVFLPLLVGLLARNYSWIGLLSSDTAFSSLGLSLIGAESLLYTVYSVILVMTYIFVPIAYFILLNALDSISTYEIEAAQTNGATGFEIVTRLVLPHTFRQASIGGFLIFANALGYFVTPRMLGGGNYDMIGNLIWGYSNLGDFPVASSLATTFLLWFSPFYLASFVLIVRSRKRIIGR